MGRSQAGQERLVDRQLGQSLGAHLAQQPHRVLPHGLPDLGVDVANRSSECGVPGPPQVHDELAQRGERRRQGEADGEPAEGSHAADPSRAGKRSRALCPPARLGATPRRWSSAAWVRSRRGGTYRSRDVASGGLLRGLSGTRGHRRAVSVSRRPCSARGTTPSRADVAVTGPDGARAAVPADATGRPGQPTVAGRLHRGRRGRVDVHRRGLERPLGTWWHDAPLKVDAGVDVDLDARGGRAALRAAPRRTARPAPPRRRASRRCRGAAGRRAACTPGWPPPWPPTSSRCCGPPAPRAGHRLGAAPALGRPAASPVRRLVRAVPALRGRPRAADGGPMRSGTFRTAMKRLPAVAAMGFDVVYLPPIHPIGEVNRKGPNNTPRPPGRHDPGSPWAIGSDEGGHDAVHPDLGHARRLRRLRRRAPRELGMEVALDLALQCAPDHPWAKRAPGVVHDPGRRDDRVRREPAEEVPGHLPAQLRQRPRGPLRRGAAGRAALGGARRDGLPGRQPAHQAADFWEWLIAEVQATDPDVLFLAEAFTRPAMMHELGSIGFTQSYTYFTWRTGKEELEDYVHELVEASRLHAAELLREHARHPARVAAVRRPAGVQDPGRAGGPAVPDLGRLRRLRALRARRGQAGQRGVPRLREVPAPPARLGGSPSAVARAVPDDAQPVRRAHPATALAAQHHLPRRSTTTRHGLVASADGRRRRARRGQPRPARRPARRPSTSTCRPSAWTGAPASSCTTR